MKRTFSFAGKQNVSFRLITNEGLESMVSLSKATSVTLYHLIKDTDKKDNCLQLGMPEVISKHNLNSSNFYAQVRKLRNKGWVKNVTDIFGIRRLMLNPSMILWQTLENLDFMILMYELGSHKKAIAFKNEVQMEHGYVNVKTGEYRDWFEEGLHSKL